MARKKLVALVDEADLHGFSIMAYLLYLYNQYEIELALIPSILGDVDIQLRKAVANARNLNADILLVADLPVFKQKEAEIIQAYESAKKALPNTEFIFLDHHPTNPQRNLEEIFDRVVITPSGLKMSEQLVELIEGKPLNPENRLHQLLIIGNIADLDCEALRRYRELIPIAQKFDVRLRQVSHSIIFDLHGYIRSGQVPSVEYPPQKLAIEIKDRFKEIEKGGKKALVGSTADERISLVYRRGWGNKTMNEFILNHDYDLVVLASSKFEHRVGKYQNALLVYVHPCKNVRDLLIEKLNFPNNKVVGHPSFALVIEGVYDNEDEAIKKLPELEKKASEIASKLLPLL